MAFDGILLLVDQGMVPRGNTIVFKCAYYYRDYINQCKGYNQTKCGMRRQDLRTSTQIHQDLLDGVDADAETDSDNPARETNHDCEENVVEAFKAQ